jgi:hypothetical protein
MTQLCFLLLLAACDDEGAATSPDLAPCPPFSGDCDPGCPQGGLAPPWYNESLRLEPCDQVGKLCIYGEWELTCMCDHHWWDTYCGNMKCWSPDGGLPMCRDGGS